MQVKVKQLQSSKKTSNLAKLKHDKTFEHHFQPVSIHRVQPAHSYWYQFPSISHAIVLPVPPFPHVAKNDNELEWIPFAHL